MHSEKGKKHASLSSTKLITVADPNLQYVEENYM
jgi:hypothetical protein